MNRQNRTQIEDSPTRGSVAIRRLPIDTFDLGGRESSDWGTPIVRGEAGMHRIIAAALLAAVIAAPGWAARKKSAPCAKVLSECPTRGCAREGSVDALLNALKRHRPKGDPTTLMLSDFGALQDKADKLVGEKRSLSQEERNKAAHHHIGWRGGWRGGAPFK